MRREAPGAQAPGPLAVSELVQLGVFCASIAVAAAAAGAIPVFASISGRRMDLLLALSAGVMLGAAFVHMLPEAVRGAGLSALPVVLLGFVVLFTLERYVLVHICEEPAEGCEVHGTLGLAAFVGISVHTLFDGIALGASLAAGMGTLVFVAVVAHKIPSSVALASVLVHERYARTKILAMLLAFALMVPTGAALYLLARSAVAFARVTPYALAFSAGTFLHLSLADLLPQVHRRGGTRAATIAALVGGAGAMWAVELLA